MIKSRHRRILANVAIAIAVGTASAAGVALAGGGGGGSPSGTTPTGSGLVPTPIGVAARNALQRLVAAGTINQAQADAVQREVDAGSVDPKTLVDSGAVSDAQMHAIADVLDRVKRSFAG